MPLMAAAALAIAACGSGQSHPGHVFQPGGPAVLDPAARPAVPTAKIAQSQISSQVVKASNGLGLKILQKDGPGRNSLVSPISLSTALSMVANGAAGPTQAQFRKVLGGTLGQVNTTNDALLTIPPSRGITLKLANSLWYGKHYHLQTTFRQALSKYYGSPATAVDFASPSTQSLINGWVDWATKGTIPSLASSPAPSTVALLLNATYFMGKWENPFSKHRDSTAQFHNSSEHLSTTFMHQTANFSYGGIRGLQHVSLPYGNGTYSMNIYLPSNLGKFLKSATAKELSSLSSHQTSQKVILSLPKFKLSATSNLTSDLSSLGLSHAFGGNANFSKLAKGGPFSISSVLQQTYIDVSEKSTVASAVTSAVVTEMAIEAPTKPVVMNVNHPFLYTISNNRTGSILFMGVETHP